MKSLLSTLFFLCLFSCKRESNQIHFDSYYFKAKVVQTSDVSCSLPVLDFSEDSTAIRRMTGRKDVTYSVLSLPQNLVIQNLKLYVLVRTLKPEEQFPCNTLGIAYPHLSISGAKER